MSKDSGGLADIDIGRDVGSWTDVQLTTGGHESGWLFSCSPRSLALATDDDGDVVHEIDAKSIRSVTLNAASDLPRFARAARGVERQGRRLVEASAAWREVFDLLRARTADRRLLQRDAGRLRDLWVRTLWAPFASEAFVAAILLRRGRSFDIELELELELRRNLGAELYRRLDRSIERNFRLEFDPTSDDELNSELDLTNEFARDVSRSLDVQFDRELLRVLLHQRSGREWLLLQGGFRTPGTKAANLVSSDVSVWLRSVRPWRINEGALPALPGSRCDLLTPEARYLRAHRYAWSALLSGEDTRSFLLALSPVFDFERKCAFDSRAHLFTPLVGALRTEAILAHREPAEVRVPAIEWLSESTAAWEDLRAVERIFGELAFDEDVPTRFVGASVVRDPRSNRTSSIEVWVVEGATDRETFLRDLRNTRMKYGPVTDLLGRYAKFRAIEPVRPLVSLEAVAPPPFDPRMRFGCPRAGISIASISAPERPARVGTLGFFVRDQRGAPFLVSCRHVLGTMDDDADESTSIVQPAPVDAEPSTTIAESVLCVPLGSYLDVAIAPLVEGSYRDDLLARISTGGAIRGIASIRDHTGINVYKVGRQSRVSEGRVSQIVPAIRAVTDDGLRYVLSEQLVVRSDNGVPFAERGDSGAPVFTMANELVGIVSAGSSPELTFVSPIAPILDAIAIRLDSSVRVVTI